MQLAFATAVVCSQIWCTVNTNNGQQSGCETAVGGSVYNKLPLSQVFHDPLNRIPGDITMITMSGQWQQSDKPPIQRALGETVFVA